MTALNCSEIRLPLATWRTGAIAILLVTFLMINGCASPTSLETTESEGNGIENPSAGNPEIPSSSEPPGESNVQQLPAEVRSQVLAIASQDLEVSEDALTVAEASRETWPDGCLGLPAEGEFCTLALVEGWRIEVTHNDSRLIYRTDLTGEIVRQASGDAS
ncbi:MAG: hypothetical protein VKK04_12735 [Synechococcales bacterium]|nr:hypothetical protein [Synechococcales bacterium]